MVRYTLRCTTMTKKVVTTTEYIDDLDGGRAEGTISFAFDGQQYEIDLSKANARAFAKAMKPYLDVARRVPTSRRRAPSRAAGHKSELAAIRTWATKNGYEVSARGRIAAAIVEEYEAAH